MICLGSVFVVHGQGSLSRDSLPFQLCPTYATISERQACNRRGRHDVLPRYGRTFGTDTKSRMRTERGSSSHGHVCWRHLEQTDKCIHKHATHSATKHSHQLHWNGGSQFNPTRPPFSVGFLCEKECCYFYSYATCHFVMGISVHLKVLHSTVGWLFVVTCLCRNGELYRWRMWSRLS